VWDLKTPSFCQAHKIFTFMKGKATFNSTPIKFSVEKPNTIAKSTFKNLTHYDTIKLEFYTD